MIIFSSSSSCVSRASKTLYTYKCICCIRNFSNVLFFTAIFIFSLLFPYTLPFPFFFPQAKKQNTIAKKMADIIIIIRIILECTDNQIYIIYTRMHFALFFQLFMQMRWPKCQREMTRGRRLSSNQLSCLNKRWRSSASTAAACP